MTEKEMKLYGNPRENFTIGGVYFVKGKELDPKRLAKVDKKLLEDAIEKGFVIKATSPPTIEKYDEDGPILKNEILVKNSEGSFLEPKNVNEKKTGKGVERKQPFKDSYPRPVRKWNADPRLLGDKSVEQLNIMVQEKYDNPEDAPSFEEKEEAIDFLTQDFQG